MKELLAKIIDAHGGMDRTLVSDCRETSAITLRENDGAPMTFCRSRMLPGRP
jgi:hypothetical protein